MLLNRENMIIIYKYLQGVNVKEGDMADGDTIRNNKMEMKIDEYPASLGLNRLY